MYKQAWRDMVCVGNVELCRYWSPMAQHYATGDQLLRYLEAGWMIEDRVEVETHWYGEGRHSAIYHMSLRKNNHRLLMSVLANPFSQELVHDVRMAFTLVPVRTPRRSVRFQAVQESQGQAHEIKV
jgi:hypothetical protein